MVFASKSSCADCRKRGVCARTSKSGKHVTAPRASPYLRVRQGRFSPLTLPCGERPGTRIRLGTFSPSKMLSCVYLYATWSSRRYVEI
eukprot:1638757-Prymnesium_polylepis.1